MEARPFILERHTRTAPLGIRFWDPATASAIYGGLVVSAVPVSSSGRPVQAASNRSGVYVFHHLPGLRDFENGAGDADFWERVAAGDPPARPFEVTVQDLERRFLPCRFTILAPHRGLAGLDCPDLLSELLLENAGQWPEETVPLFSAPNRVARGGLAVVQANLWDTAQETPAAWALLEAKHSEVLLGRGLADDQGRVALFFPYPPLPDFDGSPIDSPLSGAGRIPLTEQTWLIDLLAYYSPQPNPVQIPDLCQVLSQPPIDLWASLSPAAILGSQELRNGQELVLKTTGQSWLAIGA